jgi:hypothetical protein
MTPAAGTAALGLGENGLKKSPAAMFLRYGLPADQHKTSRPRILPTQIRTQIRHADQKRFGAIDIIIYSVVLSLFFLT